MKRRAYMQYTELVEIGRTGLTVWGYGRNKKYVCRLEINAAGVEVYAGKKGGRCLAQLTWEGLVNQLKQ
jgi:hypothetical protein